MQLLESVLKLVSKLPPSGLELLIGLVNALLSAKSPKEAEAKLRKAAAVAGYKAVARKAMEAAANGRSKL